MKKLKAFDKLWRLSCFCWAMAAILFTSWSCTKSQKSAQDWIQQGVEHFKAERYAQAASAYQQAVEKEPENAVTYNLLGMAYRFRYNQTGDPAMREKETAAFRRAVELNPRFVVAIKNLAATSHRDGNHREAAAWARRALELFPRDPEKPLLESWIRQHAENGEAPVSP
ncbi:MAG TPA: tetratricopeptide repeat protein [Candidatus Aminicenantes bacterium]|nr:tetratricopeptide repeat protein [Candidatus Aminicenantes bacterium]